MRDCYRPGDLAHRCVLSVVIHGITAIDVWMCAGGWIWCSIRTYTVMYLRFSNQLA